MKIIKPSFRIVVPDLYRNMYEGPEKYMESSVLSAHFHDLLLNIERCARISHRSEDRIAHDSAIKLLKFIAMEKGDLSVTEHASITVEFVVDRGITHELVRHRLFGFTQESTRFVRYFKEKDGDVVQPAQFIYPIVGVECPRCLLGNEPRMNTLNTLDRSEYWVPMWCHRDDDGQLADGDGHKFTKCLYSGVWLDSIDQSEASYKLLLKEGWKPQEARSLFPNALASKIAVTGNWRNWRHVLMMRTTLETHPQFRQVTVPLLQQLQSIPQISWLFEDINPGLHQSEAIAKIR